MFIFTYNKLKKYESNLHGTNATVNSKDTWIRGC